MSSGLLSLKWNNHSSTFLNLLTTLRTKDCYCDATLACEGNFYSVHKLVLSTCSEYFDEIFSRTQCKHPVIILKDMKAEEIEALLNYMYIGEVNVLQEKLTGLIKAAEALKIKGLAVPDEPPSSKKSSSSEGKRELPPSHSSSQSAKRSRKSEHIERRSEPTEPRKERDGGIFTRNLLDDDNEQFVETRGSDLGASEGDDRLNGNQNYSSDNDRWSGTRGVSREEGQQEDSNQESHDSGGPHRDNEGVEMVEIKTEPINQDDDDPSELLDSKDNIAKQDGFNFNSMDSSRGSEDMGIGDSGGTGTNAGNYLDTVLQDQSQSVDDVLNQPGPSGLQASQWDTDTNLSGLEGFTPGSQNQSSMEPGPFVPLESSNSFTMSTPDASVVLGLCSLISRQKLLECSEKIDHSSMSAGLKYFACTFCPYKTVKKQNLETHTRTHTGEKPYPCPHCDYRAAHSGNLKKHIRIHTGEKLNVCTQCRYRASNSADLKLHTILQHWQAFK